MKNTILRACGWGILFLSLMHVGTIRKKDDPIVKTQTDPITYKAKMEEIKDGVKGAPSPSLKFYGKYDGEEQFYTAEPMEEDLSEEEALLMGDWEPSGTEERLEDEEESYWWYDDEEAEETEEGGETSAETETEWVGLGDRQ